MKLKLEISDPLFSLLQNRRKSCKRTRCIRDIFAADEIDCGFHAPYNELVAKCSSQRRCHLTEFDCTADDEQLTYVASNSNKTQETVATGIFVGKDGFLLVMSRLSLLPGYSHAAYLATVQVRKLLN